MSSLWHGKLVRLRAFEPEDWEPFWRDGYENGDDGRLHSQITPPRSAEAAQRWAEERSRVIAKDGEPIHLVIENLEGEIVGSINAHDLNLRFGTFKYGFGIAEAHRRKGYGREAVVLLLRYCFRELRLQKMNAHVYAFNEPSLAFHRNLGFAEEGWLRRMVYTEGKFYDEIIFGMTAEEFEERLG